ncbi:hypothetical protein [Delftia tsuruhatensis]|uniref:hypothetical protein n=1 Tax=Delftia tsuruhatensis TaxID=180282 RepID=UPI00244CCE07|nr:hypothetical protein [Delftia tsuruhatensis]MDH1823711.1 hypothetical protein [Delftia tsuruhatensis]
MVIAGHHTVAADRQRADLDWEAAWCACICRVHNCDRTRPWWPSKIHPFTPGFLIFLKPQFRSTPFMFWHWPCGAVFAISTIQPGFTVFAIPSVYSGFTVFASDAIFTVSTIYPGFTVDAIISARSRLTHQSIYSLSEIGYRLR